MQFSAQVCIVGNQFEGQAFLFTRLVPLLRTLDQFWILVDPNSLQRLKVVTQEAKGNPVASANVKNFQTCQSVETCRT